MPTLRNNTFSMELAQNYFSQLNPIATKIAQDIQETKLAYGQIWHSLKPNEHNDIINETLIKPELSLRYFNKFSSSSSVSRISYATSKNSSYDGSNASMAVLEIKRSNGTATFKDLIQHNISASKSKPTTASAVHSLKHYNGFDQRNLCTFVMQKVALKIIHDEVLGAYRDEHSLPFSYKTKSQINLHLFTENDESEDQVCLLAATGCETLIPKTMINGDVQQTISNYKQLQEELSHHIDKSNDSVNGRSQAYERFYSHNNNTTGCSYSPIQQPQLPTCKNSIVRQPPSVSCAKTDLLKSYIDSAANSAVAFTYAVYSDAYFEHEDCTNLMQNCSSTGMLTTSSSSTVTSDDDHDDDEKTLCEDVKLLDNDLSLRKGFDFLNNW